MTTAIAAKATVAAPLGASNKQYWNVGLKCFQNGDSTSRAIQTIWNAMMPPASLTLVAQIVGALYADTYWNQTKFDTNLLAADLQASLGLKQPDCQKAASSAFSRWFGLLVRANMSSNGSIPNSDPVTASPDVVVNGKSSLTVDQLIRNWNTYIYDPTPNLKNYTYGRAQSVNIQTPITKPVLRMFYTDAGFNPPPASWVKLFTYDGSADTAPLVTQTLATTLNPGDRAANGLKENQAFAFNPPGSGHYCLITVVGTEFFTNDPSTITGNWATNEWIHYNGAAGWHNVDVPESINASLKFYNQDGVSERFSFEVHTSNLPAGSKISLQCNDKALLHPIQLESVTSDKSNQVFTTTTMVPPHHTGTLKVQMSTAEGHPIPKGSSVQVRMVWHLPPGHPNHAQAIGQLREQGLAINNDQPAQIHMGEYTFIGAS